MLPWLTEATSEAEDTHGKQLGRADRQHERPQDRDRDRQQYGAEQPAHDRRHERRPEGAPSLAALRHRMAVEHRRGRSDRPRHPEQDRRYGVGRRRHRPHADQEGERRMGFHRMGERDQQRQPAEAADARQHADDQPEHDAGADDSEALRVEHDGEGAERVVEQQGAFRWAGKGLSKDV
jgi:hypothetical protein